MKNYLTLNGQILYWTLLAPFRGQPFKIGEVFRQMVAIGVRALFRDFCARPRDSARGVAVDVRHKRGRHDFLKEDGLFDEVQAAALKCAFALKLADLMEEQQMTKTSLPEQMRTSRAALDRPLDPANTSVTLATLIRAAWALGRRVKIELVPA